MEFMDLGSLDSVYRRAKKLPEAVAAKVASEVRGVPASPLPVSNAVNVLAPMHARGPPLAQILQGYNYVYDTHKIIHRGTTQHTRPACPAPFLFCIV